MFTLFFPSNLHVDLIVFVFFDQTFLKAKYTVSLLHRDNGDLITGDSNGTVYIWVAEGNTIRNYVKHAHTVRK